jgi:hypothetical protein
MSLQAPKKTEANNVYDGNKSYADLLRIHGDVRRN